MGNILKIQILEEINYIVNNSIYHKNQILLVIELPSFHDSYAYYYDIVQQGEIVTTMDWIPKNLCKVITDNIFKEN